MLNPTFSDAAIIMGDRDCILPFMGMKQSHGFPKNLVLFSEVFIRKEEVLQKCMSNSTDFLSKNVQNLYIFISKIHFFKMLASDQSI